MTTSQSFTHIPQTERTCPTWCRRRPGHGFEVVSDFPPRAVRFHELAVGRVPDIGSVEISAEEVVERAPGLMDSLGDVSVEPVGPSSLRPPVIQCWIEAGTELTARDAREMAALLIRSADELEALR